MASVEVTFYTRRDCSLCEQAKGAIRAAISLHRLPVTMTDVDIDSDPELRARFNDDVPVIYIAGVEAFRHRVTTDEFAEYVNRTTAASPPPAGTLAAEHCVPCRGGVPPLHGEELAVLAQKLGGGWRVVDEHQLEKEFRFPDFVQALAMTNRIGALAEEEGHHPDILLAWGKVGVTLWTHAVDGLTRSDFVLAAKIDQVIGDQ